MSLDVCLSVCESFGCVREHCCVCVCVCVCLREGGRGCVSASLGVSVEFCTRQIASGPDGD